MSRLGDLYKAMETLRKEGTVRPHQRPCWYSELSSSFPILESNTRLLATIQIRTVCQMNGKKPMAKYLY